MEEFTLFVLVAGSCLFFLWMGEEIRRIIRAETEGHKPNDHPPARLCRGCYRASYTCDRRGFCYRCRIR